MFNCYIESGIGDDGEKAAHEMDREGREKVNREKAISRKEKGRAAALVESFIPSPLEIPTSNCFKILHIKIVYFQIDRSILYHNRTYGMCGWDLFIFLQFFL